MKQALFCGLALMALTGCHSYSWKPNVPEELRTVAVPTFRNESDVVELGSVTARQVLREFQREGTFAVKSADEAALEIQGVIVKAETGRLDYRRENASRSFESEMRVAAKVSVVDRRNGKVLIDNREYAVEVNFYGSSDMVAGARDASGRLAEELARKIVDDVVAGDWKKGEKK